MSIKEDIRLIDNCVAQSEFTPFKLAWENLRKELTGVPKSTGQQLKGRDGPMNAYEAAQIISNNTPEDDSELSLAMKIANIALNACVIGGCNKGCLSEEQGAQIRQKANAIDQDYIKKERDQIVQELEQYLKVSFPLNLKVGLSRALQAVALNEVNRNNDTEDLLNELYHKCSTTADAGVFGTFATQKLCGWKLKQQR
jgi:hypothetical protein